MRRIFISLIALLGLAFVQIPTESAFAAPSIRIFKASTGEEGVSSFTIPKDAGRSSWPVYIALSEAPTATVNLSVSHTGAAVLYWSGSNNLTFTSSNWSERRRLVIEYQGNAEPGSKGKITISGNGVGSREILFTVAGTSTDGTGSTDTETTDKNVTKLAENITEEDLKGLGFADITIGGLFDKIIQLMLILIALAAFLSIMFSGYQYITSAGDAAVTAKARKNILWAIIGIMIALFAFAAVRYIAGLGETGTLSQSPNTSTTTTPTTGTVTDKNGVSLIISNSANFSPSTIIIDDITRQYSELLTLQLSAAAGNVTVTVTKTGNLPVTVKPDKFTFSDQNWQNPQSFGIEYNGDGKSGDAAELIFKTSDGLRYVVRVEAL